MLTIEELKALPKGEWIWCVDITNLNYGSYIQKDTESNTMFNQLSWVLSYSDYGKSWLAYKNKEQVDSDFRDISLKCCENCRNKGFAENKCDKLTKLFEEHGLRYEDGVYSSSIDRWHKRHDLMKEFCCDDFDSCWLEYPIAVTEVKCSHPRYNEGLGHQVGQLVKIRPCKEEYGNKTYLGFYLGDLPLSVHQSFNSESHILTISTHNNPAIFVPQLNKIIFGCESWWQEIANADELNDITDECINNQWYVKALKSLDKKE